MTEQLTSKETLSERLMNNFYLVYIICTIIKVIVIYIIYKVVKRLRRKCKQPSNNSHCKEISNCLTFNFFKSESKVKNKNQNLELFEVKNSEQTIEFSEDQPLRRSLRIAKLKDNP